MCLPSTVKGLVQALDPDHYEVMWLVECILIILSLIPESYLLHLITAGIQRHHWTCPITHFEVLLWIHVSRSLLLRFSLWGKNGAATLRAFRAEYSLRRSDWLGSRERKEKYWLQSFNSSTRHGGRAKVMMPELAVSRT